MSSEVTPKRSLLIVSLKAFEFAGSTRETRRALVDEIGKMLPHFVGHINIGGWNVPILPVKNREPQEVWSLEDIAEYAKYSE